jgi:hypothetical protein
LPARAAIHPPELAPSLLPCCEWVRWINRVFVRQLHQIRIHAGGVAQVRSIDLPEASRVATIDPDAHPGEEHEEADQHGEEAQQNEVRDHEQPLQEEAIQEPRGCLRLDEGELNGCGSLRWSLALGCHETSLSKSTHGSIARSIWRSARHLARDTIRR